jgi:hypothetical protein
VYGLVAAHGQRLAQPVDGLGWSHRQVGDGCGQTFLDQRDGLLDCILVELREPTFDVCAVKREVLGVAPRGGGLGDMLDQNDDLDDFVAPLFLDLRPFSVR